MGNIIQLTASVGHNFDAYQADPDGAPKGAIVLIQEIFGINSHIQEVCDGYAADGYVTIAPALFDRVERGVELGYDEDGRDAGIGIRKQLQWDDVLKDVEASGAAVSSAGKTAIVGYCFGGSVAWLAATRLNFDCAVSYYGGNVSDFAAEKPKCPVIFPIGDQDNAIPAEKIEIIRKAHPDLPLHVYEGAGHGFNCNQRGSWNEAASTLARSRSLELLSQNIG